MPNSRINTRRIGVENVKNHQSIYTWHTTLSIPLVYINEGLFAASSGFKMQFTENFETCQGSPNEDVPLLQQHNACQILWKPPCAVKIQRKLCSNQSSYQVRQTYQKLIRKSLFLKFWKRSIKEKNGEENNIAGIAGFELL